MKTEHVQASDDTRLAELRRREKELSSRPTAEGYLELAEEYRALGFGKESDRLHQLAEASENACSPTGHGLLTGAASPLMLAEVIQMLSRTKASGDFIIDSPADTYHLFFDGGQIINASSRNHPPGVASFRVALRVSVGTYRFVEMAVADQSRLIRGDTEFLILDAMHHVDIGAAQKSKL